MISDPPIKDEVLMPDADHRRVRAALAALGLTQRQFAEEYDCSVTRANKMMGGRMLVTSGYAATFNKLLEDADEALDAQRRPQAA